MTHVRMKRLVSKVAWTPIVRVSCQKSARYRKLSTENEVGIGMVILVRTYCIDKSFTNYFLDLTLFVFVLYSDFVDIILLI